MFWQLLIGFVLYELFAPDSSHAGPILAALPAVAGAAGSAGSSIMAAIPSIISGVSMISNLFGGGGSGADKALSRMNQVSGTALKTGKPMLQRAASGQLTPAQEAQVKSDQEKALAAWRQFAANSGMSNSTMGIQMEQDIANKALASRGALASADMDRATNLLGLASNSAGNVYTAEANKGNALQAAMGEAGKIFGQPPGTPQTTPGTPPTLPGRTGNPAGTIPDWTIKDYQNPYLNYLSDPGEY